MATMTTSTGPNNRDIAETLERIAALLETQGASPFRIRAYRTASDTVREHSGPLSALVQAQGSEALERLPGIGRSIASVIQEYVETGRSTLLERLEGEVSPEDLFVRVPGIGEALAHKIHRELGIDRLEELELAAHDGRLEQLEGFGPRRVQGIRDTLAGMLSRSARRRARRRQERHRDGQAAAQQPIPPVCIILALDVEYRRKAEAGELRTIAPRRFNPEGKAWLPVLHAEKDGWSFTALYSNTARAHEQGMTRDWVVMYYERDGAEDQCTVVTERRGALQGRRVIRGRVAECAAYYAKQSS
jgi:DNA polymerase (family 10)